MYSLPTAEQYREATAEIRATARRVHPEDIRAELFELAARYDRLAIRAESQRRRAPELAVAYSRG